MVCANAGINEIDNPFFGLETDGDGWPKAPNLRTLDVDLYGAINTISMACHYMKASGGGSIIITASMAGYHGLSEMPVYSAAKHGMSWSDIHAVHTPGFLNDANYFVTGLVGLLRSLRSTAAAKEIAISLVAPGMTPTPLLTSLPGLQIGPNYTQSQLEAVWDHVIGSGVPANKIQTVARLITYLANEGLNVAGHGFMVMGDQIRELEDSLEEAWPQWLVDATEFLRPSNASQRVYEQKSWS